MNLEKIKIYFLLFLCFVEIGSHVAQAYFRLTIWSRMILNSCSSCLRLAGVEIIGVHTMLGTTQYFEFNTVSKQYLCKHWGGWAVLPTMAWLSRRVSATHTLCWRSRRPLCSWITARKCCSCPPCRGACSSTPRKRLSSRLDPSQGKGRFQAYPCGSQYWPLSSPTFPGSQM